MARHDHEYIPAFKIKIVPCCKCGTGIEVGNARTRPARCEDCAVKAYQDAMNQLREKSGPVFEKWLTGITRGIGIDIRG